MRENRKPIKETPITKARRRGRDGKPLQAFHQQKHKRRKKIKNHNK